MYALSERPFAVVDAFPNRTLYRYSYRGEWAPVVDSPVVRSSGRSTPWASGYLGRDVVTDRLDGNRHQRVDDTTTHSFAGHVGMTRMELTRRDALAVLATSGVTVGVGVALDWDTLREGNSSPNDATGTTVDSSTADAPDAPIVFTERQTETLAPLDEYATEWFDGGFRALSPMDREALLRQMGLASVALDRAGSDPERLRYYLVNELLYALYSSPTGGTLVGIENPRGYPGGVESYQHEPSRDR